MGSGAGLRVGVVGAPSLEVHRAVLGGADGCRAVHGWGLELDFRIPSDSAVLCFSLAVG